MTTLRGITYNKDLGNKYNSKLFLSTKNTNRKISNKRMKISLHINVN